MTKSPSLQLVGNADAKWFNLVYVLSPQTMMLANASG
jgi:hypothetical protein